MLDLQHCHVMDLVWQLAYRLVSLIKGCCFYYWVRSGVHFISEALGERACTPGIRKCACTSDSNLVAPSCPNSMQSSDVP